MEKELTSSYMLDTSKPNNWKERIKNLLVTPETSLPQNWGTNLTEQVGFAKNYCGYKIIDAVVDRYREGLHNDEIARKFGIKSEDVDKMINHGINLLKKYNGILINGFDYCEANGMLSPELSAMGISKGSIDSLNGIKIYTPMQVINSVSSDCISNVIGPVAYEDLMKQIDTDYDFIMDSNVSYKDYDSEEIRIIRKNLSEYVGKELSFQTYKDIFTKLYKELGFDGEEFNSTRKITNHSKAIAMRGNYSLERNGKGKVLIRDKMVSHFNNKEEMEVKTPEEHEIEKKEVEVDANAIKNYVDDFTMRYLKNCGIVNIDDIDNIKDNFELMDKLEKAGAEKCMVRNILIKGLSDSGYDCSRFGKMADTDHILTKEEFKEEVEEGKSELQRRKEFLNSMSAKEKHKRGVNAGKALDDALDGKSIKTFNYDTIKKLLYDLGVAFYGDASYGPYTIGALRNLCFRTHKRFCTTTTPDGVYKIYQIRDLEKKTVEALEEEVMVMEIPSASSNTSTGMALTEEELIKRITGRDAKVVAARVRTTVIAKCPDCGEEFELWSNEMPIDSDNMNCQLGNNTIFYCPKCLSKLKFHI